MYTYFNSPSVLPPVACPIVIKIGEEEVLAERTSFITKKENDMTYKAANGATIVGRYRWTYP